MEAIVSMPVMFTPDERRRVTRHILKDRFRMWMVFIPMGIVLMLLSRAQSAPVAELIGFDKSIEHRFTFWFGVGTIVWAGIDRLVVELWMTRSMNDPQNRMMHATFTTSLDDNYVYFDQSGGAHAREPWSHFVRIEPFGDDYLLYSTRTIAHMILRRAFTDEQWIEVKYLLDQKRGALPPEVKRRPFGL